MMYTLDWVTLWAGHLPFLPSLYRNYMHGVSDLAMHYLSSKIGLSHFKCPYQRIHYRSDCDVES